MSRHTQGSLTIVGSIAAGIFVIAFLALLVVGEYSFSPALFLALIVALVAAIVLYVGFGGSSRPVAPASATSAPAPAPASSPASDPEPKPAPVAATPAPLPEAAPVAAAPDPAPVAAMTDVSEVGSKPAGLAAPQGDVDELKKIKGVGPKLEKLLNSMGYYHFWQIAEWGPAEVSWVDENLEGFKGRVSRDGWVAQSKLLASGGETAFSKKVEGGDVY